MKTQYKATSQGIRELFETLSKLAGKEIEDLYIEKGIASFVDRDGEPFEVRRINGFYEIVRPAV